MTLTDDRVPPAAPDDGEEPPDGATAPPRRLPVRPVAVIALAVVVDPGPPNPALRARVEQVVTDRDAEVRAIAVTHRHLDHAAAAAELVATLGWRGIRGFPRREQPEDHPS
jgi:glyoxylase-like metal-dependent hydrolase (beta-lactamase superfamily II)